MLSWELKELDEKPKEKEPFLPTHLKVQVERLRQKGQVIWMRSTGQKATVKVRVRPTCASDVEERATTVGPTSRDNPTSVKCHGCGGKGHVISVCPTANPSLKRDKGASKCGWGKAETKDQRDGEKERM